MFATNKTSAKELCWSESVLCRYIIDIVQPQNIHTNDIALVQHIRDFESKVIKHNLGIAQNYFFFFYFLFN